MWVVFLCDSYLDPLKCPYSVGYKVSMPRTRKQTENVVVEVKVPEVLITRQQYFQDIKVRWQIHQYEVNKLREDVSKLSEIVAPYVKQAVDYVTEKYQQLVANRVAVQ